MTVYRTNEWKGYGKQNYYWNEYRKEGRKIVKYKCHRQKVFNGEESEWISDEQVVESWKIKEATYPEWLNSYL